MAKSPKKPLYEHEITVSDCDRSLSGYYTVDGGVVTVWTAVGMKSTQVGGSTAEAIARLLMRELMQREKG